MTERWVGPGGNDGNSGLSYALRKLTCSGAEDTPVVIGDQVHVTPGAYRELLTVDVSGGNTYAVGTVSLTNGSATVTGAGTTFVGNVFPTAGYFHVRYAENGADGVVAGDNSFTSAGADFDAGHLGMIIQINAEGAYKIATVTDANTLVLSDPNGLGWPGPADPVTWSIMSGQSHYPIASVDDNTHLTLDDPWAGPTLDGLLYLTFQAIEYIADVTGEVTDGIGGVVRITGSDNDQGAVRAYCINIATRSYRVFRGFAFDTTTTSLVNISSGDHNIIEDCFGDSAEVNGKGIVCSGTGICATIRRCIIVAMNATAIWLYHSVDVDDAGDVVENCILNCVPVDAINMGNKGGITIKNCLFMSLKATRIQGAFTTGQTVVYTNCIFYSMAGTALWAATLGEIVEDYNVFCACSAPRTNVGIGANSVAYLVISQQPILLNGFRFPWQFGALSEWSPVRALAGWPQYAVGDDLFGITRPTTAAKKSWGPIQFRDAERSTAQAEGGSASIDLNDAGEKQFKVPVDAVETTFTVQVYREANYAGTNPRLIIKQPGQADDVTTDAAAASQWNELTTTLTPAGSPDYVFVILQSLNTAAAGNYRVFFDSYRPS